MCVGESVLGYIWVRVGVLGSRLGSGLGCMDKRGKCNGAFQQSLGQHLIDKCVRVCVSECVCVLEPEPGLRSGSGPGPGLGSGLASR